MKIVSIFRFVCFVCESFLSLPPLPPISRGTFIKHRVYGPLSWEGDGTWTQPRNRSYLKTILNGKPCFVIIGGQHALIMVPVNPGKNPFERVHGVTE